ncbi:exopolyphosphatase/guanosine-5'-triphosphate,3'-diphosphate pyrophosphatase [Isoptericola jiangsuensis]|uniref:Exopolyphosphatase/guanosine-5'-triphosphate, 3'-diphosphate pyrophosphatase n=1 Tax=Isoptericola jiangsuensis TaxID=548579 RepID=A0A2A9F087_9MICO|nr:Ppx/GppA phosphatase family protein [Isoptericola jiangsuensis]PFG44191.1 exopolyphosphatase/guanosine-5'-triphosphate,3'-diphosphate pyrophosphatase [Isoptericola jiangsuensis]
MSSTRVAAVDCGTNSIRLLVADVAPDGTLVELDRRMEIVRLGQGVDRTGELAPEALERTLAATREYAKVAGDLGATKVRFVATSATRDARNRDVFVAGVRAALGVEPEVVSGQEEALLSFRGATSGAASAHPGPYLVVDLGGGSTELVLGTSSPEAALSTDVGSVRLTERHLHSDPPTAAEVAAARADVDAALDAAAPVVPWGRTATLVGLAGSVTSVTAHALGLPTYQRDRVNGTVLTVSDTLAACDDLLSRTRAQRLDLGFMHPGRADVIGAGALVWARVVERVRDDVAAAGGALTHVVTSESDILDGIALSLA